jgi:hypothetical protein
MTIAESDASTNAQPWTETLMIGKIRADPGVQQRVMLDDAAIADYADALKRGVRLPPVDVVYDGEVHWLACGFHRREAHMRAHVIDMEVNVRRGTRSDAILLAARSNSKHGVRLTPADRRKAVTTLFTDPEWSKWSNMEIARRCNVSEFLVRQLREELSSIKSKIGNQNGGDELSENLSSIRSKIEPQSAAGEAPVQANKVTVRRGDQTYEMDAAKIGRGDRGTSVRSEPEPQSEFVPGQTIAPESLAESEPWAGPDFEDGDHGEPEIEQAEAVRNEIVPATGIEGEIEPETGTEVERTPRQPVVRPSNALLQGLYQCLSRFEASGAMDSPPDARYGTTTRREVRRMAEKVLIWVDIGESE